MLHLRAAAASLCGGIYNKDLLEINLCSLRRREKKKIILCGYDWRVLAKHSLLI